MYAVIEAGGKQYRVAPGDKINIDTLAVGPTEDPEISRITMTVDGAVHSVVVALDVMLILPVDAVADRLRAELSTLQVEDRSSLGELERQEIARQTQLGEQRRHRDRDEVVAEHGRGGHGDDVHRGERLVHRARDDVDEARVTQDVTSILQSFALLRLIDDAPGA